MADAFVRIGITADDQSAAAISQAQARIQAFKASTDSSAGSLMEARGAAKLFGEEVGVNLNRHLASVLAQSSTLGPLLSAAFPIAAAVGFGMVIADGAKKMSDWVAKTYVFTDAMKDLDQTLAAVNKNIEKYSAQTDHLAKVYETIGLSGSAKTGVEATQKQQEIADLEARARDIQNNMWSSRTGQPGFPSSGSTQYTKWAGELGEVQSHLKQLNQEALNLNKTYLVEWQKEATTATEKHAAALSKLNGLLDKAWSQAVKVQPTSMDVGLGINDLPVSSRGVPTLDYGAGADQNIKNQQGWYDATRTAAEKYAATVAQLNRDFANDTSSETYQRALKQIKDRYQETNVAVEQFGKSVGSALEQGILMGRSWSDILKTVLVDVIQLTAKMTFLKDLQGSAGNGGAGGFFSSLLSGFFGGGKAGGGSVSAGTTYLVGESGPELFTPGASGRITPNGALGGVVNNYIDARGADASVEQRLRRVIQESHDHAVVQSVRTSREMNLRR